MSVKSPMRPEATDLSVEAPASATDEPADLEALLKAVGRAKCSLDASIDTALILESYSLSWSGDDNVVATALCLTKDIERVHAGDMKCVESMLFRQARALAEMFTSLARRAAKQEHLKNSETYLRMALKCQAQCRMALQTLAEIKNPPVVFARQANFANGPQQVNNGLATDATRAPAEKNVSAPTELLETSDEQRLDIGTAGLTGGVDPSLETLGAVERSADP